MWVISSFSLCLKMSSFIFSIQNLVSWCGGYENMPLQCLAPRNISDRWPQPAVFWIYQAAVQTESFTKAAGSSQWLNRAWLLRQIHFYRTCVSSDGYFGPEAASSVWQPILNCTAVSVSVEQAAFPRPRNCSVGRLLLLLPFPSHRSVLISLSPWSVLCSQFHPGFWFRGPGLTHFLN